MKKGHLDRVVAAGVTLAMVVGQVPTAAIADAADGQVPVAEQQAGTTQGASDSSDEGVSASDGEKDAGADGDQKVMSAPIVDGDAGSANDESQLQGDLAGEDSAADDAPGQDASSLIAVQANEALR